ncbi:MAG: hypothetical protein OQL19_03365 [Gammaproteobacteria bacterium]|nr:hypothetical protein [Gammaproteobacteria bacterium]
MYRSKHKYSFQSRQKGVALFISLIFLLVLTMIALSGMNDTLLDSKIVINQQDKSYSILMADATMREPEVWLQNVINQRLALEDGLCKTTGAQCNTSPLWSKNILDWDETIVTNMSAGWWGDPDNAAAWTNKLPIAYGTNGTDTYCAGRPNEKQYGAVPSSIDDGNNNNDCLANIAVPPTYIVEEASGGDGTSETRSLEVSTGVDSTCVSKVNNYFWQTTVQASGARSTTRTMVRSTYVKKC